MYQNFARVSLAVLQHGEMEKRVYAESAKHVALFCTNSLTWELPRSFENYINPFQGWSPDDQVTFH
jgi:hypothetical protein